MHTGNKEKLEYDARPPRHEPPDIGRVWGGILYCRICMYGFFHFFVSICQRPKNTVSVPHTQAPIGVFWESVFQPSESTAINMTAYETIIPKSVPAGCKFISHAFRGMFGWVKRKSYGLKKVNLIS